MEIVNIEARTFEAMTLFGYHWLRLAFKKQKIA